MRQTKIAIRQVLSAQKYCRIVSYRIQGALHSERKLLVRGFMTAMRERMRMHAVVGNVIVVAKRYNRLLRPYSSSVHIYIKILKSTRLCFVLPNYCRDCQRLHAALHFYSREFLFLVLQKFTRCHRATNRRFRQSTVAIRPVATSPKLPDTIQCRVASPFTVTSLPATRPRLSTIWRHRRKRVGDCRR